MTSELMDWSALWMKFKKSFLVFFAEAASFCLAPFTRGDVSLSN